MSNPILTGNLYGRILDKEGAPLPGVTLTLVTSAAPQVQVSNAQGDFRFLVLPPGLYTLKAQLEGFSTVEYPKISISVGKNTNVDLTMNSAIEV